MPAERPDPDDFLCERCGYVLNGLRRADACPECGEPIEQSCPEGRRGSPWQRGARFGVWANLRAFARRPSKAFDEVRIDEQGARRLEADSVAWSSVLFTLFVALRAILDAIGESASGRELVVVIVGVPVMTFLLSALLLLMLTAIERRGIRAFGRMRQRRITRAVAETIVSHAAVGWIVAALLVWGGWVVGLLVAWVGGREPWAMWELTLAAPIWMPVAGFMIGLLWFESLVYVGVRRMRFANPPAAGSRLSG